MFVYIFRDNHMVRYYRIDNCTSTHYSIFYIMITLSYTSGGTDVQPALGDPALAGGLD